MYLVAAAPSTEGAASKYFREAGREGGEREGGEEGKQKGREGERENCTLFIL